MPASLLSLDLELSSEEAQWLVQTPPLPTAYTPAPALAQVFAARSAPRSSFSPPELLQRAASPIISTGRRLLRAASGCACHVHSRLAAASCLTRPAVSGPAAYTPSGEDLTRAHVNWS